MHKQAIKHKQAIIGGGYLFTENACFLVKIHKNKYEEDYKEYLIKTDECFEESMFLCTCMYLCHGARLEGHVSRCDVSLSWC